jgi:hypothetical protein
LNVIVVVLAITVLAAARAAFAVDANARRELCGRDLALDCATSVVSGERSRLRCALARRRTTGASLSATVAPDVSASESFAIEPNRALLRVVDIATTTR